MSSIETKPYSNEQDKKEQVRTMFDNIAPSYDLLNRMLSLGIDVYWRKVVIRQIRSQINAQQSREFNLLDIATGTADLPIMLARALKSQPQDIYIKGVDISKQMLEKGEQKLAQSAAKFKIAQNTSLEVGDAEQLGFEEGSFEAVTSLFGVRNFGNKAQGLREMFRVAKSGGRLYIMEFGVPKSLIIGSLFRLYFHKLLPALGGLISKDFKAYDYLPKSVDTFPSKEEFCRIIEDAGFEDVSVRSMTFGVSNLYTATKK